MNAQVDSSGCLLKTRGGRKARLRASERYRLDSLPTLLADEVSSMHSDDCVISSFQAGEEVSWGEEKPEKLR